MWSTEIMLTDFSTPPCLNYKTRTLPSVWPLTPDCHDKFENGKFMLPLGQLLQEEPWEVLRFHLCYMHAAKLGMKDFIVGPLRSTSNWKMIFFHR